MTQAMKTVKQIPHPTLQSAHRLTPMEMNGIRCQRKHTILTPEQLDRIAKSNQKS